MLIRYSIVPPRESVSDEAAHTSHSSRYSQIWQIHFSQRQECLSYCEMPIDLIYMLHTTADFAIYRYMASVILSLPKNIVFVALGNPSNNSRGVKVAKVIAVGILVLVTRKLIFENTIFFLSNLG